VRIGELAAAAQTSTKTLRFCEESGLLPETERAANGYRDYGPEALSRLDFIWSTSIGRLPNSISCAPLANSRGHGSRSSG
jgi:DNA-binding transcriptional MerR regulator